MSGLSDHRINTENIKSKEVGMETIRDKSESDIQNEEDVLEDVQDANSYVGNNGNLGDRMSADEWEDAADQFEEMTEETEAAVLEGSSQVSSQAQMIEDAVGRPQQISQPQMTEGAVGGSQQSMATEGAVGGSQQISQAQMTEGAVGGSQQSEVTEGAVGGSQQNSHLQTMEGAVGGSQQSEVTDSSTVGGSQHKSLAQTAEGAVGGSQQSEATEDAVGESQQSEATEGAVGGSLQKSHLQTMEGAVGGFSEPCSSMSDCAVWGRQLNSQAAAPVFMPLFPRFLEKPLDPSEDMLQSKFIKMVTSFEGAPVAPSENFELQWTVYQDELEGYLTQGLLPQDTVASAGIDEKSYKQMQQCAQALQDQLFEGNLLLCLGNLRGFRRIFSRSEDRYLRHAFRGNPLEVLQNIYYGGDGILPEDRMLLDDPFHYTKNPDDLDD